MKPPTKPLLLRLDADDQGKLVALAAHEKLSLSETLRRLIRRRHAHLSNPRPNPRLVMQLKE